MIAFIREYNSVFNIKVENIKTSKEVRELIHQLEHIESELSSETIGVLSDSTSIKGGFINTKLNK